MNLIMVSFLYGQQKDHEVSMNSVHVEQSTSEEALDTEEVAYP